MWASRVAGAQVSAGVTLMAGRSPREDVTAFPQVTAAQLGEGPWSWRRQDCPHPVTLCRTCPQISRQERCSLL